MIDEGYAVCEEKQVPDEMSFSACIDSHISRNRFVEQNVQRARQDLHISHYVVLLLLHCW